MEKKEIRRKIWDSVEMHHYKVNLAVITVFFSIIWLPFLGRSDIELWITLLVALPYYGFYGYRIFQIFRAPEEYYFTRCKLANFHVSLFWKTACFSVRLEVPGQGIVNDETALIFATHGVVAPVLENYVNREALVGYNKATGRIVVIGLPVGAGH